MNIIICDDEKLFLSSIEQKVNSWAEKNGHTKAIITHSFTSSEDMLDAWEHGMQIDALFLDIQIPGELSGLAVAKQIRDTNDYLPSLFPDAYVKIPCLFTPKQKIFIFKYRFAIKTFKNSHRRSFHNHSSDHSAWPRRNSKSRLCCNNLLFIFKNICSNC